MTERISRRDLLKLGALLTPGVAFTTADVLYATRAFQSTYEITPEVSANLERLSNEMVGNISFQGFEKPFQIDKKLVKAQPNPEIFAQALLQMAYFEGGENEAEKVNESIREYRLAVVATDDLEPHLAGETTLSSPIGVFLSYNHTFVNYFEDRFSPQDGGTVFHELYHVVQFTRDPELFRRLSNGVALIHLTAVGVPPGVISYRLLEKYSKIPEVIESPINQLRRIESYRKFAERADKVLEKRLSPRTLLRMELAALGTLVGTLTSYGVFSLLPESIISQIKEVTDPRELQAKEQTAPRDRRLGILPPTILATHPSFDKLRRELFNFKEVSGNGDLKE